VNSPDTSRASHFPAIEKKYGQPMAHWHQVMATLVDQKYADQLAHLMNIHGFTRAHANALVMYSRGSTTTRRFDTPDAYFASLDPTAARTMRTIFKILQTEHPELELVVAWNQPMLKRGKRYVFGASAATKHILLAPWDAAVLDSLRPRLTAYEVNKKTIRVPIDWSVDADLLCAMIEPTGDS